MNVNDEKNYERFILSLIFRVAHIGIDVATLVIVCKMAQSIVFQVAR